MIQYKLQNDSKESFLSNSQKHHYQNITNILKKKKEIFINNITSNNPNLDYIQNILS